ncbi:Maltose acetyltransferase [Zalerion maritima]|uniref:Maltose acetyltransferase n=1 Tax=Zalerion maritima TaxID=339359 RepID=A0AAD5RLC6_9PEZI|nr:Maltose acetyltransferase [Zalerion maritima]
MASFTALNGGTGSPKATSPVNGSFDVKAPPLEDRMPPSEPRPPVGTSPTGPRDAWPERPQYQPRYPDVEDSHKRKRSDSIEPRREHAPPQPERSEEPTSATRLTPSHNESRDPYGTPQREYRPVQYGPGDESARDHPNDSWYSRQSREERSAHHSQHPDEQSGDSMRREGDYSATSPDGDDRSINAYDSHYGADSRNDKLIQGDPKKRKRVFANRTKTGCLTCRRRKKKCDEQKPECNNCIRGGFVCSGYQPQKGTWPKQDQKSNVVTIESKDPTYVPPGPYGMPQTNQFGQTVQQPLKNGQLPAPYRGQPPLRINPPSHPVLNPDDDRATASTLASASVASPDNKMSAISSVFTASTPGGANVFPTPISAVPTPVSFNRVPPLHDPSRTGETEQPTPISAHPNAGPSLPQIQILNPTRSSSPAANQSSGPTPSSNAQVAAQLALSHTSFPSSRRPTAKEEMLNGRHFYPQDNELVMERERCSASCWRFNNACNPNNGISPTERSRLFREIVQPSEPIKLAPTVATPNQVVGRVGDNIRVEGPFHCDYGYNLQIGSNVSIERNCTIMDTREVRIGDNCFVGPNASIYTGTLPVDPKRRHNGTQVGRSVVIDRDCWIGANAIILPGVTINKGSTVGAGAVVTKNVPPFTVVVGNPARVLRGVGESSM